jgi:negative regulator of sigma E activity
MSSTPPIEFSALLEDEIAPVEFDAILNSLRSEPALVESFRAQQFVRDALAGNPCPDRRYTERIMAFIAREEAKARSQGT